MEENFWKQLKRPFFALAPMDDVTDYPFRTMLARHGKPDVMWTEFVSADGLMHPDGLKALLPKLEYDGEQERPIVAQLFSASPEKIRQAAYLIADLGFDGVDINMGCPDRAVNKQGSGAALIKDPTLAKEILIAAKEGVASHHRPIPVSVKTRIGWNQDELETWLPELLSTNPAAITVHARTRKEMSLVPARWDRIACAVEIPNPSRRSAQSSSSRSRSTTAPARAPRGAPESTARSPPDARDRTRSRSRGSRRACRSRTSWAARARRSAPP